MWNSVNALIGSETLFNVRAVLAGYLDRRLAWQ
jgi:hypothetical protein